MDLTIDIIPPVLPGASMEEVEKHAILVTMVACSGSTRSAAKMLGISARKIQYRLKSYGDYYGRFFAAMRKAKSDVEIEQPPSSDEDPKCPEGMKWDEGRGVCTF